MDRRDSERCSLGPFPMNQEPLQEEWSSPFAASLDASEVDPDEARRLRFVLRQSFRYHYAGPVAAVDQRLVVVPPSRHGAQRRTFHRLSVVGAEGRASWSRDVFANSVARVRVPAVAEAVEFQVDAIIERSGRAPVLLAEAARRDPRYLDATDLTACDEALSNAAHETAGALPSGLEAAERLCSLVHGALSYRKGATSVGTTAAEAFGIGAGVCQDHAHVMIAMCRALGLPARYVSGHMLGEGSTHAWVEVILPHPRRADAALALPFDPCHGRRPGASYVTVAVGRDYRDVAPTSGTYQGGFSNHLTSATRLGVSVVEGPSAKTR